MENANPDPIESVALGGDGHRTIRKRDGTRVPFDQERITQAISKAMVAVEAPDQGEAERCSDQVCRHLRERFHPTVIPGVEQIQDIVEEVLIARNHARAAKAYILYRDQHSRLRESKSLLNDIQRIMAGYLEQSDWRVRENSNVNYSLGGLILHNSGAVTANYWLNSIYSPEIAGAHRNGDMHIHDLGMFSGYCAGWSLRQLLQFGLGGVPNRISSKPPRHMSTLIAQMVNFIGVLQNEWAGAQAFSSFDTYLAPFVRHDGLSYREVKQQIQSFVFGINTPSRWGSQAPFTNVTFDWVVPEDLADQPVLIGGEPQESRYGEYQREMDLVNRAFLEVMMEGDAEGRGFPYPIPTYNVTPEFDWESENAELLFRMTAKYGTPYFQNFIRSDLKPGDVRSMCCRLQLDRRELRKKGGGLFGAGEMTGSIGVVTVNLPRLGYLSHSTDEFRDRLGRVMDLARDSLEIKRRVITKLMQDDLFPYSKRYLGTWENHFSTVGLVGMNECCLNFLAKDIADDEGRAFALSTLDFMRERLIQYQESTGNLYNLEATPAESTSYRLAKLDLERYPKILAAGVLEPFYTNSTQLPVEYTTDLFQALNHQEELQRKYTGGTVFHCFLGESPTNVETCKKLVKAIADNFAIPYYTISPTFSVCTDHGYLKGRQPRCPECGKETEVYARIVGYYRPVRNWNKGKAEEFRQRREFLPDLPLGRPAPTAREKPTNQTVGQGNPQPVGASRRWKLFIRPACPKCDEVKSHLAAWGVPFQTISLSQPAGHGLFGRYYRQARQKIGRDQDGQIELPVLVLADEQDRVTHIAAGSDQIQTVLHSCRGTQNPAKR
ncbi:MAG: ribonucleoside triphosphate reductase [bacterium]